jgi:hypothetical protein
MYNLNNHTVIITGKRIICVDEQRCIAKDPSTGLGLFAKARGKKGSVYSGSIVYRHWNILFKDIYRVSLDMVNRETGKILSKAELEHVFTEQSNSSPGALSESRLMFVLRIHYQMEIDEEFLMFDDGTVSLAPKQETENLISSVHEGLSGMKSIFSERKKKNYELLHAPTVKKSGGLMEGLSGLMVGRKDIQAKIKDFRTIQRINRDVEEKLALDRITRAERHDSEASESII